VLRCPQTLDAKGLARSLPGAGPSLPQPASPGPSRQGYERLTAEIKRLQKLLDERGREVKQRRDEVEEVLGYYKVGGALLGCRDRFEYRQ